MAQDYIVNYQINVKSAGATEALRAFQEATASLAGAEASLRNFQQTLQATVTSFNTLTKTKATLQLNTGTVNNQLDTIIRKLRTIHTLAGKAGMTAGMTTTAGKTSSRSTPPPVAPSPTPPPVAPTAPKPSNTSTRTSPVRTVRPKDYSYRALGPSMVDSGGIGMLDMVKGMGVAYGITGVGTMIGSIIKDAAEYDNLITTTKNILQSHDVRPQFEGRFSKMEQVIKEVGVKTKFTTPEVADASKFLAMAGFQTEDIINTMRPIADIALVDDTDLGETADVVTNIMTGYNVKSHELRKVADIMSNTFTMSNTTLMEIAESYKYAGSLLSNAGISFEEATAGIGILGDAGIKGSQAGTSMRTILANIVNPTKRQKAVWDQLGIERFDANGNVRNLVDIFKDLQNADLTVDKYYRMFHRTAAQGAVALVENVDKWNNIIKENFLSEGITSKLADAKQNTIKGLWAKITSQFSKNGMEAFDSLDSQIRNLLGDTLTWVQSGEAKQLVKSVGDMFVGLVKALKDFTFILAGFYQHFAPLIKLWLTVQLYISAVLVPLRIFRGLMGFGGYVLQQARALGGLALGFNSLTIAAKGFVAVKPMLSGAFGVVGAMTNAARTGVGAGAGLIQRGWNRVATPISTQYQNAKGAVGAGASAASNAYNAATNSVAMRAANLAASMMGRVQFMAQHMIRTVQLNAILLFDKVKPHIINALSALQQRISAFASSAASMMGRVGNTTIGAFMTMRNTVVNEIRGLQIVWRMLQQRILTSANMIAPRVSSVANRIVASVMSSVNAITNRLNKAAALVATSFQSMMAPLRMFGSVLMSHAATWASSVKTAASSMYASMSSAFARIQSRAVAFKNAMVSTFTVIGNYAKYNAVGAMFGVIGKAPSIATKLSSSLAPVTGQIARVKASMSSMFAPATAAASAFRTKVVSAFASIGRHATTLKNTLIGIGPLLMQLVGPAAFRMGITHGGLGLLKNGGRALKISPDVAQRYFQMYGGRIQQVAQYGGGFAGMLGTTLGGYYGAQLSEPGSAMNMVGAAAGAMVGGGIASGIGTKIAPFIGLKALPWLLGTLPGLLVSVGSAVIGAGYAWYKYEQDVNKAVEATNKFIASTANVNGVNLSDAATTTDKYLSLVYNKQMSVNQALGEYNRLRKEELGLLEGKTEEKGSPLKDTFKEAYDNAVKGFNTEGFGGWFNKIFRSGQYLGGGMIGDATKDIYYTRNGVSVLDKDMQVVNRGILGHSFNGINYYNGSESGSHIQAARFLAALGRDASQGTELQKLRDSFITQLLRTGDMDSFNAIIANVAKENLDITPGSEHWTMSKIGPMLPDEYRHGYHYATAFNNTLNSWFDWQHPGDNATARMLSDFAQLIQGLKDPSKVADSVLTDFLLNMGFPQFNASQFGAFGSDQFMKSMGYWGGQWHDSTVEVWNETNQKWVQQRATAQEAQEAFSMFNQHILTRIKGLYPTIGEYFDRILDNPIFKLGDGINADGNTAVYQGATYQWSKWDKKWKKISGAVMMPDEYTKEQMDENLASQSGQKTDDHDNPNKPDLGPSASDYKSHYKNSSAAPKQVNVTIKNLMNVDSIDLTNADNAAVIANVKQQLTQALVDVVHDFDETWHQ